MGKLTSKRVETAEPGMLGDGEGLWLRVRPNGRKSWILRYQRGGRPHEHGLGPYPLVSLKEARVAAFQARRMLHQGVDPIGKRRAEKAAAARALTVRQALDRYLAERGVAGRNAQHQAQWRSSMETYVLPALGEMPVAEVDVASVVRALSPIWQRVPETARRTRGRLEALLDLPKRITGVSRQIRRRGRAA
jgi:Arm DNA-binding domain